MRALPVILACIPVLAFTIVIPVVNRVEPRVFGMPMLLWWIVGWILLTPVFMFGAYRVTLRLEEGSLR